MLVGRGGSDAERCEGLWASEGGSRRRPGWRRVAVRGGERARAQVDASEVRRPPAWVGAPDPRQEDAREPGPPNWRTPLQAPEEAGDRPRPDPPASVDLTPPSSWCKSSLPRPTLWLRSPERTLNVPPTPATAPSPLRHLRSAVAVVGPSGPGLDPDPAGPSRRRALDPARRPRSGLRGGRLTGSGPRPPETRIFFLYAPLWEPTKLLFSDVSGSLLPPTSLFLSLSLSLSVRASLHLWLSLHLSLPPSLCAFSSYFSLSLLLSAILYLLRRTPSLCVRPSPLMVQSTSVCVLCITPRPLDTRPKSGPEEADGGWVWDRRPGVPCLRNGRRRTTERDRERVRAASKLG